MTIDHGDHEARLLYAVVLEKLKECSKTLLRLTPPGLHHVLPHLERSPS
jgi:hypothetical protein